MPGDLLTVQANAVIGPRFAPTSQELKTSTRNAEFCAWSFNPFLTIAARRLRVSHHAGWWGISCRPVRAGHGRGGTAGRAAFFLHLASRRVHLLSSNKTLRRGHQFMIGYLAPFPNIISSIVPILSRMSFAPGHGGARRGLIASWTLQLHQPRISFRGRKRAQYGNRAATAWGRCG